MDFKTHLFLLVITVANEPLQCLGTYVFVFGTKRNEDKMQICYEAMKVAESNDEEERILFAFTTMFAYNFRSNMCSLKEGLGLPGLYQPLSKQNILFPSCF